MRTLVHVHAGRLAEEPRLERKLLIAEHLYDDSLATTALAGLIGDLGLPPHLQARDIQADPRPELVARLRDHVAELDPLADAPVLRVLLEILQRQETHLEELALDSVSARLDLPAREPYVEVDPEANDPADRALCVAELLGRTAHEHPDAPWDLHAALARLAWDAARHAAVLDRAAPGRWGERPVALEPYRSLYPERRDDRLRGLRAFTVFPRGAPATPEAVRIQSDEAFRERVLSRIRG